MGEGIEEKSWIELVAEFERPRSCRISEIGAVDISQNSSR